MQDGTIQYNTVQYNTTQYNNTHHTEWHSTFKATLYTQNYTKDQEHILYTIKTKKRVEPKSKWISIKNHYVY
jgi:hypothetical protein